ncbi:MAG: ABC transporter substrate-binding protein [Gammaproteobacteria bacterium]|nr:ABC transporter substrate-binding protein [Gammaproteobacteria bacterium]
MTRAVKPIIGLLLLLVSTVGFADPKTVFMVLWRGETDAERGFMNYLQSQNDLDIEFVITNANKDKATIPGFVEQIRQQQPDLVYTFGTTVSLSVAGSQAAGDNLGDIPLVFNIVSDPIGAGLVTRFEQHDRNLTGASHLVPLATQLNAIADLGEFSHIAVFFNQEEKNSQLQVNKLQSILDESKQFKLTRFAIDSDRPLLPQLTSYVDQAVKTGVDIFYLPSDSYMISNGELLADLAGKLGLAIFSATEGPVKSGNALVGLVSKYYLVGNFAGFKAAQILRGTPAKDIPIETLKRFNFMVNMDVAKAIDFYPPATVLRNSAIYPQAVAAQ